ncbi:hypothetical protein MPL3365_170137 [Mesorhizobium plurifarium]|uniref:Uncharacterized protein n=1 Tax=Mesorhizobium plurifarium TaxID=69974 RepID=A0A090G5M6_MESPL|nr:hypothetical protein MPL3365_170137 [Mesorhizobium plurifarium]
MAIPRRASWAWLQDGLTNIDFSPFHEVEQLFVNPFVERRGLIFL